MLKKIGRNIVVQTILGTLIAWVVKFVYKTSRWTVENWPASFDDEKKSFILASWHGRGLGGPFFSISSRCKNLERHGLASLHRDGRMMAIALSKLGIHVTDGSSRHGGLSAALTIIRTLKKKPVCFGLTPDGRKPGYKMTKGIVVMAKEARVPLILQAYSVRNCHICNNWDKYMIPYPFTRGVILFSDPITIPRDLDDDGIEYWRNELEKRLIALCEEADRRVGLKNPPKLGSN